MSTPQDLALRDALRGIDLFKKVNVPVLGMVQNMSTFICSNCGVHHDIFGLDGMQSIFLIAFVLIAELLQVPDANAPNLALIFSATYHWMARFARMPMLVSQPLLPIRMDRRHKPSSSSQTVLQVSPV